MTKCMEGPGSLCLLLLRVNYDIYHGAYPRKAAGLGWKGLTGTNTITNLDVESFTILGPPWSDVHGKALRLLSKL